MKFFSRFFKSKNEKEILKLLPIVSNINGLEEEIQNLSDKEISEKMKFIKKKILIKIKNFGKNLDENIYNKILNYYLEDVFALVRETSKRVLNMRHFDVQILGGIPLLRSILVHAASGSSTSVSTSTCPKKSKNASLK